MRIFKKKLFILGAISVFLLTSCTDLDAQLKISPSGKVTGKITYTLDKNLMAVAGYTSLEQVKTKLDEPGEVDFAKGCPNQTLSENQNSYVVLCEFNNQDYNDDKNFGVFRDNDFITFIFKQNNDNTSESNNNLIELGKVNIELQFSNPIEQVSENRQGLVTRRSISEVKISGTASEKMDVRITSRAGADSTIESNANFSPIPETLIKRAQDFQIAPSKIGGLIKSDLRFVLANSPYTISSTLEIPRGKTVYVEPGIIFDSSLLSKLSADKSITFQVQGKIYFNGTAKDKIKLLGAPQTHFHSKFADKESGIYANFLQVIGGTYFLGDRTAEANANFKIFNSRFTNLKGSWEIVYPYGKNELVNNYFHKSSQIRTLVHSSSGDLLIQGNEFVGLSAGHREKEKDCWIESIAYYGGKLRVVENDFSQAQGYALCVFYSVDSSIDARGNYWGTTEEVRILEKILDARISLNYPSIIDVSNPLKSTKSNSKLPSTDAVKDATFEANELMRQANSRSESSKKSKVKPSQTKKVSKKSILCLKGNNLLTVSGKNPKCPSGYVKR
jgi:hypothetical protein